MVEQFYDEKEAHSGTFLKFVTSEKYLEIKKGRGREK